MLARILKVKERISSDRELSEKLAKIKIYRDAIGISYHEIPALVSKIRNACCSPASIETPKTDSAG